MRTVTVEAVFSNITVFIEERSPLFGMALDTCLFDTVLIEIFAGKTAVGVVTVDTEDSAFINGMMAWQGKLGLDRLMAAEAELTCGPGGYLEIGAGMDIMTVETGDFIDGVVSGVPVMQVEGGIGRMTFETDK
jgi:hypothetical protein